MKIMDYIEQPPYWKCSECSITCNDKEVTHIFCLSKKTVEEINKNWGTDICTVDWGKNK